MSEETIFGVNPDYFHGKVVRSKGGDYYEWCKLHDDGTLEFGDEQGNYAGGTFLSSEFYPGHPNGPWPEQDKGKGYWYYAHRHLKFIRERDPDYFSRIETMLGKNGVSLPNENGEYQD